MGVQQMAAAPRMPPGALLSQPLGLQRLPRGPPVAQADAFTQQTALPWLGHISAPRYSAQHETCFLTHLTIHSDPRLLAALCDIKMHTESAAVPDGVYNDINLMNACSCLKMYSHAAGEGYTC